MPELNPNTTADYSILNLQRLLKLRSIAIAGWLLVLTIATAGMGLDVHITPAALAIFLWFSLTLATWKWLQSVHTVSDGAIFSQLMADVTSLTVLLYLTGGATNPFTMLYLLPLTVAAALLPGKYTWLSAVATIGCYSLLLFFYHPLPHAMSMDHGGTFNPHVLGMWSGFVLSACLIAMFVVKMGQSLRERDKQLAEAREKSLKDEQLVVLGALAAGAAHELGTPLGTMAIMAKELEHEFKQNSPDLANKMSIMRSQVDRCKDTLTELSASAGQVRAESGQKLPLDIYLNNLIDEWKPMRHEVTVHYQCETNTAAPLIIAEKTLSQVIINLLNNAADASPELVEIVSHWNNTELVLDICDRGSGIKPSVSESIGKSIFSTKAHGLGLGLYLSYATLERFEGSIEFFDRETDGTCTRMTLPLEKLLTTES